MVIDISSSLAVGVSAAVAILYTLMGGLYSVAYTDVIQLSFVLVGLVLGTLHYSNFKFKQKCCVIFSQAAWL